jgi:hypothetical protein
MVTHFSGLASTRCPIVTKLVSWLDMNHARDDTLHRHWKNQDEVPNSNASYGKNLAYQNNSPRECSFTIQTVDVTYKHAQSGHVKECTKYKFP